VKQTTGRERVAPFFVASAETVLVSDELEHLARTRDPVLRGELAVRHLPLVKFVARRMSSNLPAHIEMDDLVSWGSLGLLDALDKFEPARGHRFSTYAVTRIRGAILDGLQQMDWAPKQVTTRVRNLRRLREVMTNELGYQPSEEQLAERIGVSAAEVRSWLVDDRVTRLRPLDDPIYQSSDGSEHRMVGEYMADSDWEHALSGEISELRQRMAHAVCGLPPREAAVLTLYYRDGKTLRQIALDLGVSVSSATQAHTHLVAAVRDRLALMGGVA
jgi:RNA polymerase sigma factor for flagellar operon FliA